MREIDVSMFWDWRRTLTHNCLFNFIVGNRGGGKSYGGKECGIEKFIKKGEQFGYIRRYKDDLKKPMEQYFKDIMDKYPDYEFKTDSNYFYIRLKPADPKTKWTEKDIAGHGFTLSTASNRKSISYPLITTLIYDEFLLDKGTQHYLADEPIKLLNLYETIARPGTGHPKVTLFLMANAISITNPYFLFFDLRMPTKQDKNGKWIWKHPKKSILVEDVRNEKFMQAKRQDDFGGIIEGTKYADYSIDNKFILDDSRFIEKRSPFAQHWFNFTYKDRTFGVWISSRDSLMWVSDSYDPYCVYNYSLTVKDHSANTMLIKSIKKTRFKGFIDYYKEGCVRFESMNIKNLTYEVIQMVLV